MNVPSFLQGASYTRKEENVILDQTSNWVKLHKTFQENTFSEWDVQRIMIVELRTRNRPDMLARMKAQFNKLRNERENKELLGVFSNDS